MVAMAKYDPMTYKYLVTDNTGRRYKSVGIDKAAKISNLDKYDITSGVEGHEGVDSDTHNVRVQSYGKKRSAKSGAEAYSQRFAFRD